MRDKQHRDVQPLLQKLHLDAHLLAELRVQVAERLIEQQDAGLGHQRPRKRHALLLSTAQERPGPGLESTHAD